MLVSCIMPTRGRPGYALRALGCYLNQTWEDRQLIIIDDADCRSFPGGLHIPGVDYHLLESQHSIGYKRNLGCRLALGYVIAHFDDDDWSAATRLEDQVERLSVSQKSISGYHSMWFTDDSEWWRYNGQDDYAIGTSLVYTKQYWSQHPFPEDCHQGEDNLFIWPARRTGDLKSVDAEFLLFATIHPGNTSARKINTAQWSQSHEAQPRL